MDPKKKLIIEEIKSWQKNNLLPAHYCQFLLNLYQEGENLEETRSQKGRGPLPWRKSLLSILIIFSLSVVTTLLFIFPQFPLYVQGIVLAFMTIALYGLSAWLKKREGVLYHIAVGISSASLLFTAIWLGLGLELSQPYLIALLILVLFFWFLSGIFYRVGYLLVISFIGVWILVARLIHPWIAAINPVLLQLSLWVTFLLIAALSFYVAKKFWLLPMFKKVKK